MHSQTINDLPPDAFLRLPAVMELSGLKRSTIYDQIQRGKFPAPVKLTEHAAGWRVKNFRDWLADPMGWRTEKQTAA